jgi:hypothetical protein
MRSWFRATVTEQCITVELAISLAKSIRDDSASSTCLYL